MSTVTYRSYIELVQSEAKARGQYAGRVDGKIGPQTRAALSAMSALFATIVPASEFASRAEKRRIITIAQLVFRAAGLDVGKIDGYAGPQTDHCYGIYIAKRDTGKAPEPFRDDLQPVAPVPVSAWPLYKDLTKFYGQPGSNQGKVVSPFPLRIAWNRSQIVHAFAAHEKVVAPMQRVLAKVASAYSPEDIRRHGFDLFGGCFNNRTMRGGTKLSTHAWAIAADFDPDRNQLKWGKDRAYFARPECAEYIRCWESEGAMSLGKTYNYDFMHFQFCRQ